MLDECKKKENRGFTYSTIAIILGLLSIFISINITGYVSLDDFTEQLNSASLFQRSGALLTIFGILSEFFLLNIPRYLLSDTNDNMIKEVTECAPQLRLRYKILNILSYLEIILGTIIWAYGDMF